MQSHFLMNVQESAKPDCKISSLKESAASALGRGFNEDDCVSSVCDLLSVSFAEVCAPGLMKRYSATHPR